jgi:hypothetical protein
MSTPSDADRAALDQAGPLLRFAAENVNNLDPDLSLAIAQATDAQQNNRWTPEISQRFWQAFSKLCDLIKPVTLESLSTKQPTIDSSKWFRFASRVSRISLADKTSSMHMRILAVLMILVIPLQLYVWVGTNLSKETDQLLKDAAPITAGLSDTSGQLNTQRFEGKLKEDHQWSPEELTSLYRVHTEIESLTSAAKRIIHNACMIDLLALSRSKCAIPVINNGDNSEMWQGTYRWQGKSKYAITLISLAQDQAFLAQQNMNLIVGVTVSFFLPIFFGAIGAVAYVIRLISDQIRTNTFSESAPIRHLMRVKLGALMGLVVGLFSGLSSEISLPPLALAFLAGYGVEAVFSMFDGMIDRFREPSVRSTTTPGGTATSADFAKAGALSH